MRQHRLIITVREWISIHLNCFYKKKRTDICSYANNSHIVHNWQNKTNDHRRIGRKWKRGRKDRRKEEKRLWGKGNHSQTDINKNDQKH